jgi:hypothetical protein
MGLHDVLFSAFLGYFVLKVDNLERRINKMEDQLLRYVRKRITDDVQDSP